MKGQAFGGRDEIGEKGIKGRSEPSRGGNVILARPGKNIRMGAKK